MGAAEKLILADSVAIMLVIVVPVILAALLFAWWFRAGNKQATYRPDWSFSGHLELIVWAIPALVITFLGGIAWYGAHALDPYKPLVSNTKPVEIEVVSLDWKWLFIYPELHVATLNKLTVPIGTPLHFRLTSSGVMNSFFIPQLGSQVYTMAGMTTQVSLQADTVGVYPGLSAQFSGEGFADMHFVVDAMPRDAFEKWIAQAQQSGSAMSEAAYEMTAQPSKNVIPAQFRLTDPQLFETIVNKANPAHTVKRTTEQKAP